MYAFHLFSQGRYDNAMDLFLESDADPLEVLSLFPDLLPRPMKRYYVSKFTQNLGMTKKLINEISQVN